MRRALAIAMVVLVVVGAVAPAVAVDVTEPAELSITQPHYVDEDVTVDDTGDVPVYQAVGGELLLVLETADHADVTDFGIEEDAGSLSRAQDLDAYRFEPGGNATYTLYWIATEERGEENATETVEVRYEAQIQVSGTDMTHLPAGEIGDIRSDAESWRNWESAVLSERIAGPDADIAEETDVALSLLRLRYHPVEALTGDFTALLLTLFMTLSGLVIVAMGVGAHLWSRRRDIVEQRRKRQLDAERVDLEDELDAMEAYERQAALEGLDWNDMFPDDVARAFRDNLGETPLDGWLTIQHALDPRHLLRDRLHAMSDTHVAVERAKTDGGAPDAPDARFDLVPKGKTRDDIPEDAVIDLDDPPDRVIEGIALDDPELTGFDLRAHATSDLEPEVDIERLVSELEIDLRRDFADDKEVLAQYMVEFLQSVLDHEYTDEHGRVRPVRHALNLWLRALRHIGEREGIPTARYQAEHVGMLLQSYDREEEIAEWVNRVELGEG